MPRTFTTAELFGATVPQWLDSALEHQESGGNPNAISPVGAFGRRQIMPATAADPGFGVRAFDFNAPDQDAENVRFGRDYLGAMLNEFDGDIPTALVAYNAGPGYAKKWRDAGGDINRLYPETRQYVQNITARRPQEVATAEPMRLGPSDGGKKTFSTQELFGPKVGVEASVGGQQAPEGASATAEIKKPELSWGETADDVMNSGISRTAGAVTGLAGLPGDIEAAGNKALEWLNPNVKTTNYLPDSNDTSKWFQETFGGTPDYEPKTKLGGLAGDVFGYGVSGAGAGARTLAKGAIQTGLTAGGANVGREVGGVPGEIIGAIAGSRMGSRPGVMGKAPKVTAADKAVAEADNVMSPGTAAVKRVSQEAYDRANNAGVVIRGQPFAALLQRISSNPAYEGIKIPGQTFRMAPKDLSVQEFDDIRSKLVKTSMRDPDANKRRLAGNALDEMDDFFANPKNIGVGNSREAQAALNEARKNWKIYRKSEHLDSIMEAARDRAGQYSVSGHENAIRTGFRQLSTKINRDKRTRNLFTKDEIAIIRQLSRGGRMRDLARGVGAVLNNRMVQGVGVLGMGAASYAQGEVDPWTIILGGLAYGTGKGARGLSGALAKGKTNQLRRLVRSGGQMTSTPGDFRPSPMAGTLLGLKNSLGF